MRLCVWLKKCVNVWFLLRTVRIARSVSDEEAGEGKAGAANTQSINNREETNKPDHTSRQTFSSSLTCPEVSASVVHICPLRCPWEGWWRTAGRSRRWRPGSASRPGPCRWASPSSPDTPPLSCHPQWWRCWSCWDWSCFLESEKNKGKNFRFEQETIGFVILKLHAVLVAPKNRNFSSFYFTLKICNIVWKQHTYIQSVMFYTQRQKVTVHLLKYSSEALVLMLLGTYYPLIILLYAFIKIQLKFSTFKLFKSFLSKESKYCHCFGTVEQQRGREEIWEKREIRLCGTCTNN